MPTSTGDERSPRGQDRSDVTHINPDRPTPLQGARNHKLGSNSNKSNLSPEASPEGRHSASHNFYPLQSPSDEATFAFGNPQPHARAGMSGVSKEHEYPTLIAAEAPGAPPGLEKIRPEYRVQRAGTLSAIRSHIGLKYEAPIVSEHEVHSHLTWSGVRVIMREPFAEFMGMFIFIVFGVGSIAQVLLSGGDTGWGTGNYESVSWCWGIGLMLGAYVAGDSGAFLNPAVMFAFCLFRGFPWKRFPIYLVAQTLGAFCAAGVVYANYINAINNYEGHGIRTVPGFGSKTPTGGIFCTYPQPFMTRASEFFSEFIATTLLVFVIFALKDESNPGAWGKSGAGAFFPLALLFLFFAIAAAFGWETGFAINFARDFGPRLLTHAVGYGTNVWKASGHYFWVPMVAPFCGAAFGGFLYDLLIYTGPESPINSEWIGIKALVRGHRLGGDGMHDVREEIKEAFHDKDMV